MGKENESNSFQGWRDHLVPQNTSCSSRSSRFQPDISAHNSWGPFQTNTPTHKMSKSSKTQKFQTSCLNNLGFIFLNFTEHHHKKTSSNQVTKRKKWNCNIGKLRKKQPLSIRIACMRTARLFYSMFTKSTVGIKFQEQTIALQSWFN